MKSRIVKSLAAVVLSGAVFISIAVNAATERVQLRVPDAVMSEVELWMSREIPAPKDHSEAFYRKQAESVSAYRKMLEGFSMQPAAFAFSEEEETCTDIYPDYYGGSYIEEETGKLVVLIKGDIEECSNEIAQMTEEDSCIVYKPCSVSYNELEKTIDTIFEKQSVLEASGIEIGSVEEKIIENEVLMTIKDFSEEKAEIIRQIIPCGYLQIEEMQAGQEPYECAAFVCAGDMIFSSDAPNQCHTYGFAAKKGSASGFVISGHSGKKYGIEVSFGNQVIGMVTDTAYGPLSTADASFVQARGIALSNRVANGGVMWAATETLFPVNTAVSMYGAKSGLQTGKILDTNYSDPLFGNSFLKQCKADYRCTGGDSGAPVLFYEGNYGGKTRYTLLGIFKGESHGYAVFTPYKNIVKELGVTCITSSNISYK